MNEKLTGRIGRIIRSRIKALLDALENTGPGTIIEENIGKIDDAIDEARSELGKFAADRHLSAKDLEKAEGKYAELVKRSEAAVVEGRDAGAENAISELLDMEAETAERKIYISELGKVEKELELHIRDLQNQRRKMLEQLQQHRDNDNRPAGEMDAGSPSLPPVETDMGKKMARTSAILEQMRENKTGRWKTGNGDERQIEADLTEVENIYRQHRISERLSEIKKRMKKGES